MESSYSRFSKNWLQNRLGDEAVRRTEVGCGQTMLLLEKEQRAWAKRAILCRGIGICLSAIKEDDVLRECAKSVPRFLTNLAEIRPNRNNGLVKHLDQSAQSYGPIYDLARYVQAARSYQLLKWENPADERWARLHLGVSPGAKHLPSFMAKAEEVNPEFYQCTDELPRIAVREAKILIAFGLAERFQAILAHPFTGLLRLNLVETLEQGLPPIFDGLKEPMQQEIEEGGIVHYLRHAREMGFPPAVHDRIVEMYLLLQVILNKPELLVMREPRFSANSGRHNDFPSSRGGRSPGKSIGSGHNH